MTYEGPGAGTAAAGSVIAILFLIASIALPLLGCIGLVLWLVARRIRGQRAHSG
jgi:hypothetical protein